METQKLVSVEHNENPFKVWQEILDYVWGSGRIEDNSNLEEIENELDFEIGERWGNDEFSEETYKVLKEKLAYYLNN